MKARFFVGGEDLAGEEDEEKKESNND